MAIWNAQCSFGAATNVPADAIVYTFNFEGGEGATDTANIDDMLWDFFDVPTAPLAITDYMCNDAFNGDVTIKIYCQADPEPRQPRAEYFHSFTPISADTLPQEVALCLSYRAANVSGQPEARRRGRVYLGPFSVGSSNGGRPEQALIDNILVQAAQLKAAADASVTWQWIVWSRASSAGYPVVGGWIDDAWDTQRRRGVAATNRYPFE